MLVVPPLTHVGDATVFADDCSPSTFYVVPDRPRIRRDARGSPAVALTLYQLDEKTRAQAGSPGDATIQVDIDLDLADDQRALIAAELQPLAAAASAKRRLAQAAGPLTLVQPTWSRCGARLWTGGPDAERIVAEANASVLTCALARFDAPLSADQGVLLESLFEAPLSAGLSASFDLAFFGRLPAAALTVDADPGALYELLKSASDGYAAVGCSATDLDTLSDQGLSAEALASSGVVGVRLDPTATELHASALAALRKYALARFTALVRARFFEEFAGPGSVPRYRLRARADVIRSSLSLSISGADVIEWPLSPQTSDLLSELPSGSLSSCVRRVTLGDPFWDTLDLRITAYADFGTTPIAFVEVDIEYDGGDATRPPFQASLVFDANGVSKTLPEAPPLRAGSRSYRYQTKVAYAGASARVVSAWTTTDRFNLDVWAADPAKLDLTVIAGDIDFSQVRSVTAAIAFEDAGLAVVHPVILTAEAPSASLVQYLSAPLAAPARVTPTFYLVDGTTIASDAIDAAHSITAIRLPAASTLQVSLLLSGDLSDVAQVLVELVYDGGDGYFLTADRRLVSLDDLQRWTVVLRDAARTAFSYSVEIDYHHRPAEQRAAVTASGSQAIAIEIVAPPALRVAIHPLLVDFDAVPLVSVDLVHDGATPARATLPFTTRTPQTWQAPLAPGEPGTFSYVITYHPSNRDAVVLTSITSSAAVLVIPAYEAPASGLLKVRVLGSAVDFAAMERVQVDVRLLSDATAHASVALTAAEPSATLELTIPTGISLPRYTYSITFVPHVGAPVALPDTVTNVPLLVPRLP